MAKHSIKIGNHTRTRVCNVADGTISVEFKLIRIGYGIQWEAVLKQILKNTETKYPEVSFKILGRHIDIINIKPTLVQAYLDDFLNPLIARACKALNDLKENGKSAIDKIVV